MSDPFYTKMVLNIVHLILVDVDDIWKSFKMYNFTLYPNINIICTIKITILIKAI